MAMKTWYFSGEARWAKLREPDDKYNKYSIDLIMEPDVLAKFKTSGAQLKIREKDGTEFVTFNRPATSVIKGDIVNHGPPEILDKDGEPLADNILVGNGSKVTLKVEVYDTVKGKGSRLAAVRVDDLVKYEKPEVDEDEEEPF